MKSIVAVVALSAVVMVSILPVQPAGGAERKLKIDEVPAPVRAALEQQAKGGTIIDVDVNDDRGAQVYTSEIHRGKEEIDVRVAPDGKVLSVDAGNAPAPPPPPTALETVTHYRFWLIGIVAALVIAALWFNNRKSSNAH